MTKYSRQIRAARKLIARKGTTVVWFKQGAPVDPDDPTPEFSELGEGVPFPGIPAAFYPLSSTSSQSDQYVPVFAESARNLYCVIPGDLPFTPENGDAVMLDGPENILHVDKLNVTAPDGIPIIYEVSFK